MRTEEERRAEYEWAGAPKGICTVCRQFYEENVDHVGKDSRIPVEQHRFTTSVPPPAVAGTGDGNLIQFRGNVRNVATTVIGDVYEFENLDEGWTIRVDLAVPMHAADATGYARGLGEAAATAWGRCPVTHEPHAWREPIETKNEQNILIALPACVNCHVLRSTLEPEATGSAVQTAWVDPETLDRTSG